MPTPLERRDTFSPSVLLAARAGLPARFAPRLGPSTARQADDQSVACLSLLGELLDVRPIADPERWGVVACPDRPARRRIAETLDKFRIQGAATVSPGLVPFLSLHSMAGLLSQAAGLRGPNLGSGGIDGSSESSLPIALGWLASGRVSGVILAWAGDHGAGVRARVAALPSDAAGSIPWPRPGDKRPFWDWELPGAVRVVVEQGRAVA